MPYDETGNEYIDMVAPGEASLARPMDIPASVNALVQAGPDARRAFFQQARQRMTPENYRAAVSGLVKAAYAGRSSTGGEAPGPAGTFHPSSPLPRRPGPAAPDDPAYQQVLAASGVQHRHQRYINDPGVR